MKLTYHKNNNWKEKYFIEVRKAISDLYENQYAPVPDDVIKNDELFNNDLLCYIYKKRKLSNSESELDLYLETPIVFGEVNLLQWWKVCIIINKLKFIKYIVQNFIIY